MAFHHFVEVCIANSQARERCAASQTCGGPCKDPGYRWGSSQRLITPSKAGTMPACGSLAYRPPLPQT